MKKKTAITVLIAIAFTGLSQTVLANDMFGFFLKKQNQALPAVINYCLFEGDNGACGVAMRDLIQAEMGLVSYGKNYLDDDLYSRLANDLGEHQHQKFAWLVLKERLKKNNCALESVGSVFP